MHRLENWEKVSLNRLSGFTLASSKKVENKTNKEGVSVFATSPFASQI